MERRLRLNCLGSAPSLPFRPIPDLSLLAGQAESMTLPVGRIDLDRQLALCSASPPPCHGPAATSRLDSYFVLFHHFVDSFGE